MRDENSGSNNSQSPEIDASAVERSLEERIEDLKTAIQSLEANDNLSSREFEELRKLQAELDRLETEGENAVVENASLSVRPLQRRDLQMVQTLIREYPQFSRLEAGDQLDRLALVLTEACKFGGVTKDLVERLTSELNFKINTDVDEHFKNSVWTNREGESDKRYVNNFADAFKLEPGLRIKLLNDEDEGSRASDKVVKKVAPKAVVRVEEREENPVPVRIKRELVSEMNKTPNQPPKSDLSQTKNAPSQNTKTAIWLAVLIVVLLIAGVLIEALT
ncbi:MAG: hypothetical protein KDD22_04860 [Bdellovibrionales bacterium]|nr:hypothetical protein [Bdellovibrionales bacterium]